MRKTTIEYSSPLDALIAVVKRLQTHESRHGMSSEEFYDRFAKGQTPDDLNSVEWSNDYRHYLALRLELEGRLRHAA